MKNLNQNLYNPYFSHIYVEKKALGYSSTTRILSLFKNSVIVEIDNYKDVVSRRHQSFIMQKNSPALVLAVKENLLVYEGAPVCQNFGNKHFYYTSLVLNCFYDCEYCYLQGMYPSANIVVFVNLEDFFSEVENYLRKYPVYLCISYDTDLLALESILGYVESWAGFAKDHPKLSIEVRTKSANYNSLGQIPVSNNFILAWTLSPEFIIENFEHRTPPLKHRLMVIKKAQELGFPVRLCFDPMIYCVNWKEHYEGLFENVFSEVDLDIIRDVSLGSFRVSKDYLKIMRKQRPDSVVVQYPYENIRGVFQYDKQLAREMIEFAYNKISKYVAKDKIYVWEGSY